MRLPPRSISQAPSSKQELLASRWYASINEELQAENIPTKTRHGQAHPGHHRNTLGKILMSNHHVMDKIGKFDTAVKQQAQHIESRSSISTEGDMRRAAETRLDSTSQSRRQGLIEERDEAPPPMEHDDNDEDNGAWHHEERENQPQRTNMAFEASNKSAFTSTKNSGIVLGLDSDHEMNPEKVTRQQHPTPDKSLADEVTICSEFPFATRAAKAGEALIQSGSSLLSNAKSGLISPKEGPVASNNNFIFDYVKSNFFQRSTMCTPPINSTYSDDEGKKVASSLWSYLDPNNDLKDYEDDYDEDLISDCSSDDRKARKNRSRRRRNDDHSSHSSQRREPESRHRETSSRWYSPTQNAPYKDQTTRASPIIDHYRALAARYDSRASPILHQLRASPPANQSASLQSANGPRITPPAPSSSPHNSRPTEVYADILKQVDPYQEVYEDLLFMARSQKREISRNSSHQLPRTSSPIIYGDISHDRSSPQSTSRYQHGMQTKTGDMYPKCSGRTPKNDNTKGDYHTKRGIFEHDDRPPRVRISVTSNSQSNDIRPSRGRDRRIRDYETENNEVADAFRTEKETSIPLMSRSRSKEKKQRPHSDDPKSRTNQPTQTTVVPTVRYSSEGGSQFFLPAPVSEPFPADVITPRRSGKSPARRDRRSLFRNDNSDPQHKNKSEWISDLDGIDFDALAESLNRGQTGAPAGLSMEVGSPTVRIPNPPNMNISFLSDDSTEQKNMKQKLSMQLNKVICRSVKNVERLQDAQEARSRIPERLPGAPEPRVWSSSDSESTEKKHSINTGYADCINRGIAAIDAVGRDLYEMDSAEFKMTRESQGASSGGFSQYRQNTKYVPSQHRREDFEGHYMYVAYSRFGEDARDVIQICEHASVPIPSTRSGEVLVKVLVSVFISCLGTIWHSCSNLLSKLLMMERHQLFQQPIAKFVEENGLTFSLIRTSFLGLHLSVEFIIQRRGHLSRVCSQETW